MILPQGSLTLIQRPGQQAQLVQTISSQEYHLTAQNAAQQRRPTQIQQNQQNNVQPIQVQQQVVQPAQQQQRKGLTLSVWTFLTFKNMYEYSIFINRSLY